jgi:hypothetical protein
VLKLYRYIILLGRLVADLSPQSRGFEQSDTAAGSSPSTAGCPSVGVFLLMLHTRSFHLSRTNCVTVDSVIT